MKKRSIWRVKGRGKSYSKLLENTEADVVIIGGGITGLTTALQLTDAGRKVVVVEAHEIGSGTTGFSSCHLTTDIDEEYRNVISTFDKTTAQVLAESRKAAIDFIEKTTREKNINCDFRRLPGYLYSEIPEDVSSLKEEQEAASAAGLDVKLTDTVPLPFTIKKGLRFEDQGEFNAQEYLAGLAEHITSAGGRIYENSLVKSIEEKENLYHIKTDSGSVKAPKVVMATHLPLFMNVLQTVAAPYISYMIAAKLKQQEYPVGLFWDMADPYHYTRYYTNENGSYVVVGGEDHKTGHKINTEEAYQRLEKYIRDRFDIESIDYKWSAQYYEPADGIPFIGNSPFHKNIYVATGFSGDGLVYGTVAGILISDMIMENENAWLSVYDATRFTPAASAVEFIKENADVAKNFIKDRLTSDTSNLDELKPGEGKIVKINGEKMAVARDEQEELHAVSPVCTHMKCHVHWNTSEKTWDCPCHGSRFSMQGEVIYGPAVKALEKKEIKAEVEEKVKK